MGCGSAGAWKSIKALICCELDQTHSGSSSNDDCNFPLTGVNEEFTPVPEAQTWEFDIFEYALRILKIS
jgi:hypothetical protein